MEILAASILSASIWSAIGSFFGFTTDELSTHRVTFSAGRYESPTNVPKPPSGAVPTNPADAPPGSRISETPSSPTTITIPETASLQSSGTNVSIYTDETYRYIVSNGIPNHDTGEFPNAGNPNTISEQNQSFRVALNPVYANEATPVQRPGVGLNGIVIEPGTAERNGSWSYEAIQDVLNLGLDFNNAHVQPTGTYHYHGVPTGLVELLDDGDDIVHVGWAADGHRILYSKSGAYEPGYVLKSGTRPDIGGTYDGTYTQDFEYVEWVGDLDDCNGKTVDGSYSYFVTEEFPYYPRCLHGTPDESFAHGPGAAGMTDGATGASNGPHGFGQAGTGSSGGPSGRGFPIPQSAPDGQPPHQTSSGGPGFPPPPSSSGSGRGGGPQGGQDGPPPQGGLPPHLQ